MFNITIILSLLPAVFKDLDHRHVHMCGKNITNWWKRERERELQYIYTSEFKEKCMARLNKIFANHYLNIIFQVRTRCKG